MNSRSALNDARLNLPFVSLVWHSAAGERKVSASIYGTRDVIKGLNPGHGEMNTGGSGVASVTETRPFTTSAFY